MPAFPHTLCTITLGGGETAAPVVARSEMERGIPHHRRTAADARVQFAATLVFATAADSAAFDTWFYSDALAGAAWFDFTHPRTGAVVQARVVGGELGGLTPMAEGFRVAERQLVLEYIRPSFVQLPPGLHAVAPSRILSVQLAAGGTTPVYVGEQLQVLAGDIITVAA